ncbi:hypothetical protein [Rhodococcus sp. BS-15]|uniref:hypothetical protein n=1 Tax=Rhodococcus sp. BS-15 TaxID=1304954 RepID=UPI000A64E887|nr:hypothetical protein [Rhodococcus sp. BS-15]
MASEPIVSAVYEFPRPIWVSQDLQGQRFDTRIGPIVATIVMPTAVPPTGYAMWGPPELVGVPESALAPVPGEPSLRLDAYPDGAAVVNPVWDTPFAAEVQGGGPATALRAVGLELSEDPAALTHNDTRSAIGDAERSFRLSVQGTPEARIADLAGRNMEKWFTRVAEWVSVLTQQDLDHRHQIYDASLLGPGFRHWDGAWRVTSATYNIPSVTAIGAEAFGTVLCHVGDRKRPALEWQLLLQAAHSINRGFFRRAVLDCATAAETCVTRLVDNSSSAAGKPGPGAGLRNLSEWLTAHEKQSYHEDSQFIEMTKLRNTAIHNGIEPTSEQTLAAASCAYRIVEAHGHPQTHAV